MSSQSRMARDRARRERARREEEQRSRERRRRALAWGAATVLAVGVTAVVVTLVVTGDEPAAPAAGTPTEVLEAEASADAQASAVAAATAAGEVLPEDHTVEPGTPGAVGRTPVADDRPVACDAPVPATAADPRPRYPGGPADALRDGVDYRARIATSCGPIVIDLFEEDAPVAVNSFVFLAEEGFYDGLQVFRDFGAVAAAEAGSGDNTVDWDIGYRLPDELDLAEREGYPIGTVTTAGEGPYTAGSEFFIVYGEEFDAGFETDRTQTVLGRVVSGMDVIDDLAAQPRAGLAGEAYAERLFMESVTIIARDVP